MSRTSRILVVETAPEKAGTGVADSLAARGFQTTRVDEDCAVFAELLSSQRHEALVVANDELLKPNSRLSARDMIERIAESDLARHLPFVVLGERSGINLLDQNVLDLPAETSPDELAMRVESVTRLSVLARELERRLRIAQIYGGQPTSLPLPQLVQDPRVLVAYSPQLLTDTAALMSEPAQVTGAMTPPSAMEFLETGAFDLVLVPGDDIVEAMALIETMRRDTRFAELPIVVTGTDASNIAALCNAGASASVAAVNEQSGIAAKFIGLASEHRYRLKMRQALANAMPEQGLDALTGLVTHGYFSDWLRDVIEACDRWGETLTLVAVQVDNLSTLNTHHGHAASDRLVRGIGSILANLTRAEDCACRYTGSRFLIGMPATPTEAARIVRDRLMSVLEHSPFADDEGEIMEPVLITGVTSWRPGLSPIGLVEDVFCGHL